MGRFFKKTELGFVLSYFLLLLFFRCLFAFLGKKGKVWIWVAGEMERLWVQLGEERGKLQSEYIVLSTFIFNKREIAEKSLERTRVAASMVEVLETRMVGPEDS